MAKDGELRDAIRVHDAPQIAAAVYDITKEALDGLELPEDGTKVGLKGKVAREVAEMAVRVVADYVCTLWRSLVRRVGVDANYVRFGFSLD